MFLIYLFIDLLTYNGAAFGDGLSIIALNFFFVIVLPVSLLLLLLMYFYF